jgi:curli production assembly/transport component CsgF
MGRIKWCCLGLVMLMEIDLVSPGLASQLVYRPVNPSFGGHPFNSFHLQGTAHANNRFAELGGWPSLFLATPRSGVRLLFPSGSSDRLSAALAEHLYGEAARNTGRFVLDNTWIEFRRVGDQVHLALQAPGSGTVSHLRVPVPRY